MICSIKLRQKKTKVNFILAFQLTKIADNIRKRKPPDADSRELFYFKGVYTFSGN
jgi:hypothetical protein